jgi:hypothetical protein
MVSIVSRTSRVERAKRCSFLSCLGGAAFMVVKSTQGIPLVFAPIGADLEVKLLLEYMEDVLTFA